MVAVGGRQAAIAVQCMRIACERGVESREARGSAGFKKKVQVPGLQSVVCMFGGSAFDGQFQMTPSKPV